MINDLLGRRIDDVARRWVSIFAVNAERYPARLLADLDRGDLLRRRHFVVEDMQPLIGGVANPDFLFVRRQTDAMARAAVALDHALFKPLNLHAPDDLAGFQIGDFVAEQLIDVDISE